MGEVHHGASSAADWHHKDRYSHAAVVVKYTTKHRGIFRKRTYLHLQVKILVEDEASAGSSASSANERLASLPSLGDAVIGKSVWTRSLAL